MTKEHPFLTVVRGNPSPAEVAALVAVLTARARATAAAHDAADTPDRHHRPSRWADRSRLVRGTASGAIRPHGPGSWRASGLPR